VINAKKDEAVLHDAMKLLELLEDDETSLVVTEDAPILFYVSGCFARSIANQTKCGMCQAMVKKEKEITVSFDDNCPASEKDSFISLVDRGGLIYPSDMVYVASMHLWQFFQAIKNGNDAFNHLLATPEQRKVFTKAAVLFMESSIDTEAILTTTCEEGHSFKKIFQQLACKMFNCFIKNLCKEQNSKIHFGKKRGPGRDAKGSDNRKICKLLSL